MKARVIAIDGPAASGKSTAARNLAAALGIPYINTGSLYRAIAWKAARNGVGVRDENALVKMLAETDVCYAAPAPGENPDIRIDGVFPGGELRSAETAAGASAVATIPAVRAWALGIQRAAAEEKLVVMEGRDIGTAVFPDAQYKFFLTASPLVRAQRRFAQNDEIPPGATVESIAAEIAARDKQDSERATAPLRQAEDAELIDSSDLTQEQVLALLLGRVRRDLSASIEYRIPFADTDQMGVVYYANYFVYFEMARAELLRAISFSYSEMEHAGYGLPVLEAVCHYKAPARFEDRITITARLAEIKGVRLRVACTVTCGGRLLAEGYTWHACMSSKTGRPVRPPAKILNLLEEGGTSK